jgi:hypothetical protein
VQVPNFQYQELATFDPYQVLELEIGATEQEIKKAFRRLSLLYHPDKDATKTQQVSLRHANHPSIHPSITFSHNRWICFFFPIRYHSIRKFVHNLAFPFFACCVFFRFHQFKKKKSGGCKTPMLIFFMHAKFANTVSPCVQGTPNAH